MGDYALGIALNWTHFTAQHLERIAMGSFASCYADAGIAFRYRVGSKTEMGIGVSFTHFSNGALVKPNKGINLFSLRLSADCMPRTSKPRTVLQLETFEKHYEDMLSFFAGGHGVLYTLPAKRVDEPNLRRSYLVFGVDMRRLKRFSRKHSFGAGAGFAYDEKVGTDYRIISRRPEFHGINHARRFNLSAFLSYEYRISHLGVVVEPGIYLYRDRRDDTKLLFQRIGLRYFFDNGMLLGINLRAAQFSVAQCIEWSFGCAIPSKQ